MLLIHDVAKLVTIDMVAAELAKIEQEYPGAHDNGLTGWEPGKPRPSNCLNDSRFLDQVQNCTDWLHHFEALRPTRQRINLKRTAYGAKHLVESWARKVKGEECGAPADYYVCMMAFIVAARLGGLEHNDAHNPSFNIFERVYTDSENVTRGYGWQARSPAAVKRGKQIAEKIKEAYDCGVYIDALVLERTLDGWNTLPEASRQAVYFHLEQCYHLVRTPREDGPATFKSA